MNKVIQLMVGSAFAALLAACGTAPVVSGQAEAREAPSYATGSNLARRDRSGDNVKVADKDALQQQLNAAGKNLSEAK